VPSGRNDEGDPLGTGKCGSILNEHLRGKTPRKRGVEVPGQEEEKTFIKEKKEKENNHSIKRTRPGELRQHECTSLRESNENRENLEEGVKKSNGGEKTETEGTIEQLSQKARSGRWDSKRRKKKIAGRLKLFHRKNGKLKEKGGGSLEKGKRKTTKKRKPPLGEKPDEQGKSGLKKGDAQKLIK